jgi:TonB family protein
MTNRFPKRLLSILFFGAGFLATVPAVHAQVKVSTVAALKAAINKPAPEYPTVARQVRAFGKVEVEVSIAADGKVEDVRIISGNPILTKASVKAAKDWTFTPFIENGQPSRALAVLSFEFKL